MQEYLLAVEAAVAAAVVGAALQQLLLRMRLV
jgi:hypothetical protein